MIRPLVWSRTQMGSYNGKVGALTMAIVAWHTGDKRWFVSMKLPGGKAVPVDSEQAGKIKAEELYRRFVALIGA